MPEVTIKGKKIKLPYTKSGKALAIKLRKKKKRLYVLKSYKKNTLIKT